MKRTIAMLSMLATLAIPALAQDSGEKTTALKGRVEMAQRDDGQTGAMLRLANRELVAIDLPEGEAARLQLRDRDRLTVNGVFIGKTDEDQAQARILARSMVKKGKTLVVQDPVRLTERDRLQIRAYEDGQLKAQARVQTKTQTQSMTGNGNGGGGGGSSSDGSGGGPGGAGGGKK